MKPGRQYIDFEAEEESSSDFFSSDDEEPQKKSILAALNNPHADEIRADRDAKTIAGDYLSAEEEDEESFSDLDGFIVSDQAPIEHDSDVTASPPLPPLQRNELVDRLEKKYGGHYSDTEALSVSDGYDFSADESYDPSRPCPTCGHHAYRNTSPGGLLSDSDSMEEAPPPRPEWASRPKWAVHKQTDITIIDSIPKKKRAPSPPPVEQQSSMATIMSGLGGSSVKELFGNSIPSRTAVMLPDGWGDHVEIIPYERWRESTLEGNSDDTETYYVSGPRKANGRADCFVVSRQAMIDEMVPLDFGNGILRHVRVKTWTTKVSLIKAREIGQHLGCVKKTSTSTTTTVKKITHKRREAWRSPKMRQFLHFIEMHRRPVLRAARAAGAAYVISNEEMLR